MEGELIVTLSGGSEITDDSTQDAQGCASVCGEMQRSSP